MRQRLCPLILLSTLTLSQTKGDGHITQTTLNHGDNFTMSCTVDKTEAGILYFYKMTLESLVQTVAEGNYQNIIFKGNFRNSRFKIHTTELQMENVYIFTILNVTTEDAASYVCHAGSSYKMSVVNTSLLIILDQQHHTFYVKQIPQASVPLGRPVQLKCSLVSKNNSTLQCPSKRNVHWFKSGAGESPASIFYTYEEQTEEQNQRRCVYSLSTTIQDVNDTGTYYCAVATCGHVLFGPGTRVEMSPAYVSTDLLPVCFTLGVLLLCSVVINAVMFCLYRKAADRKDVIPASSSFELLNTVMEDPSNDEKGKEAGVNYVALEFPLRKVKRSNMKNGSEPECLYSATREYT